jgi:hypothetical protein
MPCCLNGCAHSRAATPRPQPTALQQPTLFTDVAEKAGVNFALGHGGRSPLTIQETLGNGCALADFDGDGWLDILLVGPNRVALYHNNHDGTFTDTTAQSGLRQSGEWQGVAVGDYDNDGREDLYISGYRCCALYHNEGNGRFKEVTHQAGLDSNLWGTSACFVDVDNDAYLDLYVAHYVKFYSTSQKFCQFKGRLSTCGPTNYDPERGTLYHNNGDGTFRDETVQRGLGDAHGNALGVAIADYDGRGLIDIAIANDQLPGDLYRNKGKGFFENVGLMSGTSYDVGGNAHAGMGADWADVNGDGRFALVVTTYQAQPKSLYEQSAPGLFADACYTAGIGRETQDRVGFGVKFFDYDNDGHPDLIIANGHAVDTIGELDHTTSYPQKPQLFHNRGDGRFEEVSSIAGPDFHRKIVGRGLAVGDFDNDGREDAVIVDLEGHALLLHNEARNSNHWLSLKLQGVKSNRDGIGAVVSTSVGGHTWKQMVTTSGSFMSASDIRVHIGLGAGTEADRIEIRWPSGTRTVRTHVKADQFLNIVEGK